MRNIHALRETVGRLTAEAKAKGHRIADAETWRLINEAVVDLAQIATDGGGWEQRLARGENRPAPAAAAPPVRATVECESVVFTVRRLSLADVEAAIAPVYAGSSDAPLERQRLLEAAFDVTWNEDAKFALRGNGSLTCGNAGDRASLWRLAPLGLRASLWRAALGFTTPESVAPEWGTILAKLGHGLHSWLWRR